MQATIKNGLQKIGVAILIIIALAGLGVALYMMFMMDLQVWEQVLTQPGPATALVSSLNN